MTRCQRGFVGASRVPHRPTWVFAVALVTAASSSLAGQADEGMTCESFCGELTARYLDDGCAIEAEAIVNPFNNCDAALPGQLLICLYKNAPSSIGGTRVGECLWLTDCAVYLGNEHRRVSFSPWPSPGTTAFFVEAWINPGDSNTNRRCDGVDPVRLPAIPPGDSDNDGVDTCADNCPNTVNPLQVDVDEDGKGDACDSTKGDLNGDGVIDEADLETFLACFGGSEVLVPPPGCAQSSFDKADLDRDFDVDIVDLRAFQVFFGQ